MRPLKQPTANAPADRAAEVGRSARRLRNVGILVIAALALACVVSATAIAWNLSGSIAWATLALAIGLLLSILWALVLVNLWCSTLRRMTTDYVATIKSHAP